MRLRTALDLFALVLGLSALSVRAEAQATTPDACPAGQPCVVVVSEPPPADARPATVQVVVQPPAAPEAYAAGTVVVVQQERAQPTVRRTVRRSRARWGMIAPGIVLTVVGWFGNWITGIPGSIVLSADELHPGAEGDYFGFSFVPVIGPFVNAGFYAGSAHDGFFALHLLWGVMQASGVLLCILGSVLQEEIVEVALGGEVDAPRFSVLPWGGRDGAGLTASVAF